MKPEDLSPEDWESQDGYMFIAPLKGSKRAKEKCEANGIELRIPAFSLCTDNGAMIAALGAQLVMAGRKPSNLDFGANSTLPVTTVQTF